MRFGSVCSGIGSAESAWQPLGWTCSFMSEIAAFPRAVLKHRFPDTPLHGDFTTIQEGDYDPIELLVGGTPCQGLSVAGRRGGFRDDRSVLALEYSKLADRLRPRWVAWENVPGAFTTSDGDDEEAGSGEDFAAFLSSLCRWSVQVPEGGWKNSGVVVPGPVDGAYGLAWRVIDAQFCRTRLFPWAVPQRRRRVFVVGYIGDWRPPAAVLLEPASLSGHPPPRREARKGTTWDVAPSLTGSGRGVARPGETRGQDPVIAVHDVTHTLRGEGFDASEDGTGRGTPLGPAAMAFDVKNGLAPNRSAQVSDAAFPLKTSDHKDVQVVAFGGNNTEGPISVATAVNAHAIQAGAARENPDSGPDGMGVREGDAFTLEARAEVQLVHAFDARQSDVIQYGDISGPLDTCGHSDAVAFALRGREGGALPEVEGDGHAAGALRAASGGSTRDYIAFTAKDHGGDATVGISPTLRAGGHEGSHANAGVMPAVTVTAGVRRLTPRECSRLQAFPDDWAQVPWRGKAAPDGPMYKAYGNSMARNVMHYLGERIDTVDRAIKGDGQ